MKSGIKHVDGIKINEKKNELEVKKEAIIQALVSKQEIAKSKEIAKLEPKQAIIKEAKPTKKQDKGKSQSLSL